MSNTLNITPREAAIAARDFYLSGGLIGWDARETQCVYRGVDGARCAIGVSIPDALYDPTWEGKGVDALMLVNGKPLVSGQNKGEWRNLQNVHDYVAVNTLLSNEEKRSRIIDGLERYIAST